MTQKRRKAAFEIVKISKIEPEVLERYKSMGAPFYVIEQYGPQRKKPPQEPKSIEPEQDLAAAIVKGQAFCHGLGFFRVTSPPEISDISEGLTVFYDSRYPEQFAETIEGVRAQYFSWAPAVPKRGKGRPVGAASKKTLLASLRATVDKGLLGKTIKGLLEQHGQIALTLTGPIRPTDGVTGQIDIKRTVQEKPRRVGTLARTSPYVRRKIKGEAK